MAGRRCSGLPSTVCEDTARAIWPRKSPNAGSPKTRACTAQAGKLVEKYNVRDAGAGAGGEYPVQDGFGWTNAVLIKLLAIYPKLGGKRYEFLGSGCSRNATLQ